MHTGINNLLFTPNTLEMINFYCIQQFGISVKLAGYVIIYMIAIKAAYICAAVDTSLFRY